jgi:nitrogen fixation NifU-like protein
MGGNIIMDSNLKRSIILDNYQDARNRGVPSDSGYIKINSNNDSCIDNIDIYVKLNDTLIEDIKFEGEACVIAISSTSILSELLIGKRIDEVNNILKNYYNMIEEKEYDKDLLGECCVYDDIYKQPSRKTCVTLFARGIEKIIKIEE